MPENNLVHIDCVYMDISILIIIMIMITYSSFVFTHLDYRTLGKPLDLEKSGYASLKYSK